MDESKNRHALIRATSALFRRRGYAGVGLSEILAETGLPKGSLYYHFPGGKEQLAAEATRWAGRKVAELIDVSFDGAASFAAGSVALCRAIANLSREDGRIMGCPVLSIIQAGDEKPDLRRIGADVLNDWTSRIAAQAARLGRDDPQADAERLVIGLQGAWVVSLARQDVTPFETLERGMLQPV
ncbi:TetR/AcrR family transcriptional regulator [Agrobacterium sp. NPDC089420]|uniref:TetR/AcrR family transcriptional regulator n=1 Tax=Agrobacterium sp. NPDC089420 TaxID=3363918 RepID=UPI00384E5006